jgi:hypothetical protein
MYPFERFTERAKKVLTLAQEEAERSHHSYIGTEHLLLGLLRQEEGLAAKVLNSLGVEIGAVRSTIESVLGRNERLIIQQIIPTSRVKLVIEISFEEARRMGNNYVGTEHLLLGLLIEGEGIAAHVLEDLGANLEKVRAEIARLPHEMPPESAAAEPKAGRAALRSSFGPPSHTLTSTFSKPIPLARLGRPGPGNPDEIWRAAQLLAAQQYTVVGVEHLLLAALDADPLVRRMLGALGIDDAKLAEVRRIATPPASLLEMRRSYEAKVGDQRAEAVETEEYQRLRDELNDAERRWRAGEELTGGESEPG